MPTAAISSRVSRFPTPARPAFAGFFWKFFEQFGLPTHPQRQRVAFASRAPAALSELSAWWLKRGIRHERIEPGKPHQNGCHERMHLTLKLDTAMPPFSSLRAQQRAFDQ